MSEELIDTIPTLDLKDFLDENVKLYKEYNFESIIYEEIYKIIIHNYSFILDFDDFDIEYCICDALQIYFHKNNCFRSYAGTSIINRPKYKQITKKLEIFSF